MSTPDDDLLKLTEDTYKLDKEIDGYYDRLYKITAICFHLYEIDPEAGNRMLRQFTPAIEALSEKLNKSVEDYTRRNGEL